jgi:hypothetical protein
MLRIRFFANAEPAVDEGVGICRKGPQRQRLVILIAKHDDQFRALPWLQLCPEMAPVFPAGRMQDEHCTHRLRGGRLRAHSRVPTSDSCDQQEYTHSGADFQTPAHEQIPPQHQSADTF